MKYLLLTLLLICSQATVYGAKLKPFTSDGCSAFPDGTLAHSQLWLKCCTEHDNKYWAGGTRQERIIADQNLHQCVNNIGEPAIAQIMLAGVRVGGSPYLPTTFRWGYGWPYLRGYKALSIQEKATLNAMFNNSNK